ncbi:MAG: radical SAM protein [Planctomycetia bacterium]|nr:radical SAM protein [Planctomycetia bacterium]
MSKQNYSYSFSLVSLGCPKNLTDSETMSGMLIQAGWNFKTEIIDSIDLMIINSCGFLQSARDETFEQIDIFSDLKSKGIIKRLIVTGCVINSNAENLQKRFSLVDAWLSPFDEHKIQEVADILFSRINNPKNKDNSHQTSTLQTSQAKDDDNSKQETETNVLEKNLDKTECLLPNNSNNSQNFKLLNNNNLPLFYFHPERQLTFNDYSRRLLTAPHIAYLKIADGCDRFCSYCSIPSIRGRFVSKTKQNILDESKRLADQGVRELVLIAQETTFWGKDLYGQPKLAELLAQLKENNDFDWIRVLYTYPLFFSDELISLFKLEEKPIFQNKKAENIQISNAVSHKNENHELLTRKEDRKTSILPYIDIPLQHCNDQILKHMNRRIGKSETEELLTRLREKINDLVLRTTMIVGFPGETEEIFMELIAFMKKWKFERAGIFEFSAEKGTPAFDMKPHISQNVKARRYRTIYRLQENISKNIARSWTGKILNVLIDDVGRNESGNIVSNLFLGRTFADSPDIDPIVYITGENLKPGELVPCEIVTSHDLDLIAVPVE